MKRRGWIHRSTREWLGRTGSAGAGVRQLHGDRSQRREGKGLGEGSGRPKWFDLIKPSALGVYVESQRQMSDVLRTELTLRGRTGQELHGESE